eukprot:gene3166-3467_t
MDSTVGITEFLHPDLPGIRGIIKSRFSDFIVREVTTSGEVLYLHDISVSAELRASLQSTANNGNGNGNVGTVGQDAQTVMETFLSDVSNLSNDFLVHLDQQTADDGSGSSGSGSGGRESLLTFLTKAIAKDEDCPEQWLGFPSSDKSIRSALHQVVKTRLAAWIESSTAQQPEGSFLRLQAKHILKASSHQQANKRRRIDNWPKDRGDFLEFTLLKENIDTMSAVHILTRHLHLKPDGIAYNGTKDKRGVTTQRCTVYRKLPAVFDKINLYPHRPRLRVGDYRYVKQPAKLGSLQGNRFEIVLRGVKDSLETIKQVCDHIHYPGFINYFGLQRFGKGGSASHLMGLQMIKSNWKDCVDMLFTSRSGDRDAIVRAKEFYLKGDFSAALASLPEAMHAEKLVLRKLSSQPTDFMNAFQAMSKNMRLICVHAYQSYIWNLAASERLRNFGFQVIAGDVVTLTRAVTSSSSTQQQGIEEEELECVVGDVKIVSEEDVQAGRYTIHDVVLPLIGERSLLPSHSVGPFILQLLEKDGLSLQSFKSCHPSYRLAGSYRRLIQEVKDFEWKVLEYSSPDEELVETELNRFCHADNSSSCESVEERTEEVVVVVEEEVQPEVKAKEEESQKKHLLRALQLKFTLSPGSYATMFLREVTKESTESDYHAQLDEEERPPVIEKEEEREGKGEGEENLVNH